MTVKFTTLRIPVKLHRSLKIRAAEKELTLETLVSGLLRQALKLPAEVESAKVSQ